VCVCVRVCVCVCVCVLACECVCVRVRVRVAQNHAHHLISLPSTLPFSLASVRPQSSPAERFCAWRTKKESAAGRARARARVGLPAALARTHLWCLVVRGLQGLAQNDGGGAHRLLNEPAAVSDVGDELQHLVAHLLRPVQEPAHASQVHEACAKKDLHGHACIMWLRPVQGRTCARTYGRA